MKKLILSAIGVAAVLCAGMLTVSLAAAADPGSSADPLVSKSYVDSRIEEVLSKLGVSSGEVAQSGESASYTPVSVSAGQSVLGGEGTEIILRSGKAVGLCPGQNGLTNVTSGREVGQGEALGTNNLIIVPREDGRGVTATTDAWFLIRGSYTIQ